MAKPVFIPYETVIPATFLNQVADTVWDALGEATTPAEAITALGAVEETDQGSTPVVRVAGQWIPLGPTEIGAHNNLLGRFEVDAHPIESISGLSTTLSGINDSIGALSSHSSLVNRDDADSHPTSAITGLDTTLEEIAARMGSVIYVDGLAADGVTDDHAAIQAALDEASSLVAALDSGLLHGGVGVQLPYGNIYLSAPLVISYHGVSLIGAPGRGTTILCGGAEGGIYVGDSTNAIRVYGVSLKNLAVKAVGTAHSGYGIKLYRSVSAFIDDCDVYNFNVGVHSLQSSTTFIDHSLIHSNNRTAHGLAGLLLEGVDASQFTAPTEYAPGGGMHVTDCEFTGGDDNDTFRVTNGILIRAVDGFYMQNCHAYQYVRDLVIEPEASAANHVITDVHISNCYFDGTNDGEYTTDTQPTVLIGGTVNRDISLASGALSDSLYQGIRFSNCLIRAAFRNRYCVRVAVTDAWPDGFQVTGTYKFNTLQFTNNQLRMSLKQAFSVLGANSGAYAEPIGLSLVGNNFYRYNSDETQNVGAAIDAEVQSATISANHFGAAETTNNQYIIRILSYDDTGQGTDVENSPSLIAGNNLSETACTAEFIRVVRTVGSQLAVHDNLLPSSGLSERQTYTLTTVGNTPVVAWSRTIVNGVCGTIRVLVTGRNANAAKAVVYEFYAGLRRAGGTLSLNTGTSNFTSVRAWNPDSIASPPTATITSSDVVVTVTGTTAETWTWTLRIEAMLDA